MNNIKPWEDRAPLCPTEAEITASMEAEIAELRAALSAPARTEVVEWITIDNITYSAKEVKRVIQDLREENANVCGQHEAGAQRIEELEAALASQASKGAGVQEGWLCQRIQQNGKIGDYWEYYDAKQAEYLMGKSGLRANDSMTNWKPLYAAPSPAQAQPVADAAKIAAIEKIVKAVDINDNDTMGSYAADERVIWAASGSWNGSINITLGDMRAIAGLPTQLRALRRLEATDRALAANPVE